MISWYPTMHRQQYKVTDPAHAKQDKIHFFFIWEKGQHS